MAALIAFRKMIRGGREDVVILQRQHRTFTGYTEFYAESFSRGSDGKRSLFFSFIFSYWILFKISECFTRKSMHSILKKELDYLLHAT